MQQFKSIPIPPNTLIGDLALPRFLKPYDLTDRWKVQQINVTISRAVFEEVPDIKNRDRQTSEPQKKMSPVIYFQTRDGKEFPRGMCLDAAINVTNLRQATGVKTVGEMAGKRITIGVENTKAFGKTWVVLRISPRAPSGSAPAPETPEPSILDEIDPADDVELEDIIGAPDEPEPGPDEIEEAKPKQQPAPLATSSGPSWEELIAQSNKYPIMAYERMVRKANIDSKTAKKIVDEKKNYKAACDHVVERYARVQQ